VAGIADVNKARVQRKHRAIKIRVHWRSNAIFARLVELQGVLVLLVIQSPLHLSKIAGKIGDAGVCFGKHRWRQKNSRIEAAHPGNAVQM
jgi:hypothetical protein